MFEKFRNNNLKNYGLCPNYYLSTPALIWDVMLRMTKIELELIPDPGEYMFFENSTIGEACCISNRYSKDSNKYLKSYDPKQESKNVIQLDANNLHVYALSKVLLKNGFKWADPKEFDLNKYTSKILKGCVLEVDLKYPKELRELHNDYPLAPDRIEKKRNQKRNAV